MSPLLGIGIAAGLVVFVAAASSFRRRGRHLPPVGPIGRVRDRLFLLGDWDAGGRNARFRRYSGGSTPRSRTCGDGGGNCGSGSNGGCGSGSSCGAGGCGSGGCGGGGCGGGGGS
jgi:hypothetical protein